MQELGIHNPSLGLESIGFNNLDVVRYNFGTAELYEEILRRSEAQLTADGAVRALTGQHTGRSPKDKFVVRDENTTGEIWWDNNNAMSPEHFAVLHQDMLDHAKGKSLYAQDLIGGADAGNALPTRVVTEFAWHSLFIRNLLIRPDKAALAAFTPKLTIIDLPDFKADPARHGCRTETVIACNFTKGIILIGGTSYAGEMKKAVFTMLNYLLPARRVMPMHCSANVGPDGDAAVFFGLSGTGKTTLSADPKRTLIGDDEHGWGEHGIFNFEGGCYAKTIRLSAEAEPEIFATTRRFGTVLENVVLDENRKPDFNDGSLTENTRCAYPLDFIPNASKSGTAGHPGTIIMLTADAFGVMPPIARLTPDQAKFHCVFLPVGNSLCNGIISIFIARNTATHSPAWMKTPTAIRILPTNRAQVAIRALQIAERCQCLRIATAHMALEMIGDMPLQVGQVIFPCVVELIKMVKINARPL